MIVERYGSSIDCTFDSVPGDRPGLGLRVLHEAGDAADGAESPAGLRFRRDGGRIGALSGIVEPVGGALVLLLASAVLGIMPFMLAFAAGAMLYVVVEELVPEYSQGKHSNIGTVGFALGFALMMVLDVVLS